MDCREFVSVCGVSMSEIEANLANNNTFLHIGFALVMKVSGVFSF
jgi:hypothetical protein